MTFQIIHFWLHNEDLINRLILFLSKLDQFTASITGIIMLANEILIEMIMSSVFTVFLITFLIFFAPWWTRLE